MERAVDVANETLASVEGVDAGESPAYSRDHGDVALEAALQDETRRELVEAIAEREPVAGSELAEAIDRDPATVTHHLQRLADADLVEREREGKAIVNRLTPAAHAALRTSNNGGGHHESASDDPD